MASAAIKRGKAYALDFAKSFAFDATIDIVVTLNAAFVGLQVDAPAMVESFKDLAPTLFCVVYILEFVVRFMLDAKGLITRHHILKVEMIVVLLACIGVFVMPGKKILWRLSVFRVMRSVRIVNRASRSVKLADLWLVLAGYWTSLRTVAWLMVILFVSMVFFGGAVRGFIYAGPDDDDLNTDACGGDAFRVHLRCLDVDQYFGSVYDSALTMMQVATLDRWAAHVVRPLAGMRPVAAMFLFCFVCLCSYGLLSITTGVIVWSTIELAKLHDTHRDRVAVVQDRGRIRTLREYFGKCLELEDRDLLDLREIKEALQVPQVRKAYEELDLPVTDLQQLWAHLDTHSDGEITLDQFEYGCMVLLEPAKRYDMATLSAKLNGRGVFCDSLSKRCDATVQDMDHLFSRLTIGFAKMREYVMSEDVKDLLPEVSLRRAGKMHIPRPEDD